MTEHEIIFKDILKKFSRFPIPEDESTFLDLCHYSGERFEEICSRILEFYFQPNNKHGFRDLWYRSLCQLISCEYDEAFEMTTRVEEFTYSAEEKQKRIDMILETPSRIIAIENKIWAGLYNHLNVYKEHVEKKYNQREKKLIVLTARPLWGHELKKVEDNRFDVVLYKDLFEKVRSLIGEYVSNGNQKYLVFMLDFMKTVENRANIMIQTDLDKFFEQYKDDIEKLINQYNKWRNNIFEQQKCKILELKEKLRSQDNRWWDYQGWDLGISFNDNTLYRIGIESNFNEINNDPLSEFHIRITTWKLQCWDPYEEDILKKYPEGEEFGRKKEIKGNRVNYHMPIIDRKTHDSDESYYGEILKHLNEYYQFLKGLAEKVIMDPIQ